MGCDAGPAATTSGRLIRIQKTAERGSYVRHVRTFHAQHSTWAEVHAFLDVLGPPRNLQSRYNIALTTESAGMSLIQIIYVSQPFGFDQAMLNGILMDSRRNNLRDDVTGALICRADAYLQLIEGPEVAIRGTYARIASDNRHADVTFLFGEPVTNRLFPEWAMRDDPARSWMWTPAQVTAGAIAKATRPELLAVFERLKAEAP